MLRRGTIALLLPLACDAPPPGADGAQAVAPSAPARAQVSVPEQLAAICRGEAVQPVAAPYEKQAGKASPVAYFYKDETFPAGGEAFSLSKPNTLRPWSTTAVQEIQLVACLNVTASDKVRECPFNSGSVLELYSTTSTLSIYEAKTGTKLSEQTITKSAEHRGCPATALMHANRQRDYGGLDLEATQAIGIYQPPDAPPPQLPAWTFKAACDGKPALGGATPSAEPGSLNPFAVFLREGTNPFVYGDVVNYSFTPEWFQPNLDARSSTEEPRASLAVCMTSTSGTKPKRCGFSGSAVLQMFPGEWSVTVVETGTGKTVATKTFKGATACPTVWDFARGDTWTAEPGAPLVEWLTTFVQPT